MPKLFVSAGDGAAWTAELKPGLNTIGRSEDNNVQIANATVSGHHCQIDAGEEALRVRDLGSTNGTFIDDQPITEGVWAPGQTLRIGMVELRLDLAPVRIAIPLRPQPEVDEPTFQPDGSSNCLHHPTVPATEHCQQCNGYFCPACVRRIRKVGGTLLTLCPACSGPCEQLAA